MFHTVLMRECHRGQHLMVPARQAAEDVFRVGRALRLADDRAIEFQCGVGREHRLALQAPSRHPFDAPLGFGACDAHDIGFHGLTGQNVFADVLILTGRGAK